LLIFVIFCYQLFQCLAIRNAQLLQSDEPLHSALEIALVSLRTNKATVGGVLACVVPCGCGVHGGTVGTIEV